MSQALLTCFIYVLYLLMSETL